MGPTKNPSIVPRRKRSLLTSKEVNALQEQGIHEDCCQNDLSIMMARYALDKSYTFAGEVLTGEKMMCEEVKQQIKKLFDRTETNKGGMYIHAMAILSYQ